MSRAWRYCYESPEDMPDEVMVTSYGDPANPVRYVRVVTCGECKYAPKKARHMWCQRPLWCDGEADHYCEPDDFCCWGEAR